MTEMTEKKRLSVNAKLLFLSACVVILIPAVIFLEIYLRRINLKLENLKETLGKTEGQVNALTENLEKKFLNSEVLNEIHKKSADYCVIVEAKRDKMYAPIGSGFFVSNNEIYGVSHLINGEEKIRIKFKERLIAPLKIYSDGIDKTDVMVIVVPEQSDVQLPVLGNSDNIKVGDFAVAVGNPYGFKNSFVLGVISGLRRFLNKAPYIDFIQSDVLLGSGNSGGPLLNLKREIIGINEAIINENGQSISFSLPINDFKKIAEELKVKGKIKRAFLGINAVNISDWGEEIEKSPESKKPDLNKGIMIQEIAPGGPAEKAGFKKNDIIIKFDGIEIENTIQALRLFSKEKNIGKKKETEIVRDGKILFLYPILIEAN